jgi:hypothetical protein
VCVVFHEPGLRRINTENLAGTQKCPKNTVTVTCHFHPIGDLVSPLLSEFVADRGETMVGINGRANAQPLEMEALHQPAEEQTLSSSAHPHILDRLLTLLKLYIEHYPYISSVIFFTLIGTFMVRIAPDFEAPVVRNRLQHDYSNISAHYNFKASQMDHWCLWVRFLVSSVRGHYCLLEEKGAFKETHSSVSHVSLGWRS